MRSADLDVAYVLGCGPSLPVHELYRLHGEFAVGANWILRSGFAPKVLWWWDKEPTIGQGFYDLALSSPCIRVAGDRGLHREIAHHTLPHARPGDEDLSSDYSEPHRFVVRGSSGASAARWCFGLGFEHVVMLGFGGQGHFYDPKPHTPITYDHFDRELGLLLDHGAQQLDDNPEAWPLTGAWDRPAATRFVDAKLSGVVRPKLCPV